MRDPTSQVFPPLWRRGVYEAIYRCRDVRRFLPRPISDKVLRRIIRASNQGSPGSASHWTFLAINDPKIKHRVIQEVFQPDQTRAARPETIEQAPINLAVACDRSWIDSQTTARQTLVGSEWFGAWCALQNLVLAARAEGIAMRWIDSRDVSAAAEILELPKGIALAGYGVMGYAARSPDESTPEMTAGEPRVPLDSILFYDRWGNQSSAGQPNSPRATRT